MSDFFLLMPCKSEKEVDFIAPFCEHLTFSALRYGSHSFTCKLHDTWLYLVSFHEMAPLLVVVADI